MKNPGDDRKEPPFFEPYPGSVLLLQARYVLTIGEGGEIALPGEVRWGFALNEGDLLICERRLFVLALPPYRFQVSSTYPQLPSDSTGRNASAASPPQKWPPPTPSPKPLGRVQVSSRSASRPTSFEG